MEVGLLTTQSGMPLSALAMVLAAALLHALWNLAAKKAGGDHRFAFISSVMVTLGWAPVAVWFGLQELATWSAWIWACVLASAVLHLSYFNVLLTGYRLSDLTVVYPVARGSAPLLSVLGAWLWLGESLSAGGAIGAVLVCGGVFVIAGGPALWRQADNPVAQARVRAGLRWGLFSGAFIAGYTVVDGYAVKLLLVSPVLLDYMGNVLRVPFLAPAACKDRAALAQAWRTQWRYALVVAGFGPLAYVLVLYAVRLAPLSHVAPARELSMLFAALIGGHLLGEGDRRLRLAGALCMAVGVMALAVA
jgi:drug/metabolite transporter (DMT)-like permease